MALQQILACAVGEDIIKNESNVVEFEDHGDKVMMWWGLLYLLEAFLSSSYLLKVRVA